MNEDWKDIALWSADCHAAITAAIAAERNACAMVAEDERVSGETGTEEDAAYNCACCDIARAIRARR